MITKIKPDDLFRHDTLYWFYQTVVTGLWVQYDGGGAPASLRPRTGEGQGHTTGELWLRWKSTHVSCSLDRPSGPPPSEDTLDDASHVEKIMFDNVYALPKIVACTRAALAKGRELQAAEDAVKITGLLGKVAGLEDENRSLELRYKGAVEAMKDRDKKAARANHAEFQLRQTKICLENQEAAHSVFVCAAADSVRTLTSERDSARRDVERLADQVRRLTETVQNDTKPREVRPDFAYICTERDALRIECNSLRTRLANVQRAITS